MALKVFSPSQAKSAQEERVAKDALRAKNISDITQELLKERDAAEKDFERTIIKQQAINERLFEEKADTIRKLRREVEDLELRKERALIPLTEREKVLQSQEASFTLERAAFEAQKLELEEKERLLMRSLDEVSHSAQELEKRKKNIKALEEGNEMQRQQIAITARELNLKTIAFYEDSKRREEKFAFQQSELDARKLLLDGKERSISEREKQLLGAKREIASQREVLSKAFNELRKQSHGK